MWKKYTWNPSTCSCKTEKYLSSIMDDLVIMWDEVISSYNEETKTVPTNFINDISAMDNNKWIRQF